MIRLRKAEERGHFDHGWLDTWHTFSFADYYDPDHMGFRTLRVINDDRVAAGEGFGTHPHRDMEIITYVLTGALAHKDSMGNGTIIRPGEVQRMTAGTGVTHSEENPSPDEPVHLLQIWIVPEKRNLTPGYEQKAYSTQDRRAKLKLVASRDGREDSVTVHQDMNLYATVLASGESVEWQNHGDRHSWIQVARGSASLGNLQLKAGDGVAISGEESLKLVGKDDADILVFDLN